MTSPAVAWVGVENLLERAGGVAANVAAWSGALAVTCFALILVSGVYLFLFYQVGAEASYRSVQALSAEPVGALMRAVHRYASRGFIVFALVHLLRYLVTGRFRGPWWLPWMTGFILLFIAWFVGLTGYLLVWDVTGFTAAWMLAAGLDWLGIFGQPLRLSLTEPGVLRDNIFLILLYVHVTVPLLGAFFGWLHLARVVRPRLLPPVFVAAAATVFYVGLSIFRPVPVLEPADPARLADGFPVDPFYLTYMALPSVVGWLLLGSAVGLAALPLIGRRPPAARVDPARCTGCGFCVADCPYGAVRLQPGRGRPVAVVDPARCVGCGLCVGACPLDGIELGSRRITSDQGPCGRTRPGGCDLPDRFGECSDRGRRDSTTVCCCLARLRRSAAGSTGGRNLGGALRPFGLRLPGRKLLGAGSGRPPPVSLLAQAGRRRPG